jgi:hypothetical protein
MAHRPDSGGVGWPGTALRMLSAWCWPCHRQQRTGTRGRMSGWLIRHHELTAEGVMGEVAQLAPGKR